jgi:hypothetical protein
MNEWSAEDDAREIAAYEASVERLREVGRWVADLFGIVVFIAVISVYAWANVR